MQPEEVSSILDEIATYLELKNENPFKVRAYANASRVMKGLGSTLHDLLSSGELRETKGIGKGIYETLEAIDRDGKSPYLEELRAAFPEGLRQMLQIPGLGPKKVRKLYEKLKIESLESLAKACQSGAIGKLEGFGEKTARNILQGIEFQQKYAERKLYSQVYPEAVAIEKFLKDLKEVERISIAGSLRRHLETIKDIDLVCSSSKPQKVMDAFVAMPQVATITAHGETKSAVVLKSGLRVDLRAVSAKEFPYALHHFTGSKAHNTALRTRAKSMGMKMNEYGLFKGEKPIPCKDEAEIFSKLKLHYIPAELREDNGEIEEAEDHDFNDLVEIKDIKGIFHVHTQYSDGANSLEEMVKAALERKYHYLGITDHSQSAFYANGLKADRIKKQADEIAQLREKYPKILILHGIESDILKNGDLDYPDKILKIFDFVIGSVHGNFNLNEKEMTARIVKALQNPYLTMLGHPTGRLLLSREAFPVNMETVIEKAVEFQKIVEINANPHRFDLDWRLGKFARAHGMMTCINPDAHSVAGMDVTPLGVGIARKAGFRKNEVLNTRSAKEISQHLLNMRKN